ncbi:dethiobiotin synthase [Chryseobacterium sp. Ch-15]|uniref:ATP-dependent dethiobiotin synthetase BioD n=1 Tax=Chryseobacterium muglaense TaxID=2893752 RepID=A0A9Q3YXF2_9FLAO|nr:dethiobiotin synthase [Chryseobacterium muglaense]MCC9036745.1 dethiobiotin synthase [Chryseobacterium muglaense]MCM2555302.1 dethiobiotin synthase [Chryseobacterium muglaense]
MDIKKGKLEIQDSLQKKLFITGIGTEVGKTVCSAILTKYFKADYWKPIQSGDLDFSDSMKIKEWVGGHVVIHPEIYRLQLAASPHQSAAEEGVLINSNDFKIPETQNNLIVEGAGGLMVPISDEEFIIDLIEKLNLPVALVVRNYLGCINHTLLSLMLLEQKNIKIEYLILNGSFPSDSERIICNYIEGNTKIVRIADFEIITKESIENTLKQLEKIE